MIYEGNNGFMETKITLSYIQHTKKSDNSMKVKYSKKFNIIYHTSYYFSYISEPIFHRKFELLSHGKASETKMLFITTDFMPNTATTYSYYIFGNLIILQFSINTEMLVIRFYVTGYLA